MDDLGVPLFSETSIWSNLSKIFFLEKRAAKASLGLQKGNEKVFQSSIWSNYSDLTRPHPKWWFGNGDPLFRGNLGWWNIVIWPDPCSGAFADSFKEGNIPSAPRSIRESAFWGWFLGSFFIPPEKVFRAVGYDPKLSKMYKSVTSSGPLVVKLC